MHFLLYCVALLALLPLDKDAKEPFFCERPGAVMRYERRFADNNKLKWTQEVSILDVSEAEGGKRVSYKSEFRGKSGKLMYGGPVSLEMLVFPNGDIGMDLSASLKSVASNYVSDSMIKGEPCFSVLPSSMKEGDVLEDAVFEVTVAGIPCKVSVTDRKVVGRERITVPAGTFDCVVVLEHKSQRLGKLVVSYAYTWYAAGIGMIRHDTYIKGSLKTTERLVSLIMPE